MVRPKLDLKDRSDAVFRALGNRGRRSLLVALSSNPGMTLGELTESLPMTRQAVSQHLQLLADAELISTTWQGREKLHYLNAVPVYEAYVEWIDPLLTRAAKALVEATRDVGVQPGRRAAGDK